MSRRKGKNKLRLGEVLDAFLLVESGESAADARQSGGSESLDERLNELADTVGPDMKVTVSKEAPWKEKSDGERMAVGIEHAYRQAGMSWEDIDVMMGRKKSPDWRRGDMVVIKRPAGKDITYEQLLVASDNPDINDAAWLVVADANDWNEVGKFYDNSYLAVNEAELLYRPTDRAVAAVTTEPVRDDPPRSRLLFEAEGLITGDRNASYGSPTENFQNTADLWSTQFKHLLKDGVRFTAAHVAQAMMHLKMARMIAQPKRDNYLDLAGYAACGWECEEEALPKPESARRSVLLKEEWKR